MIGLSVSRLHTYLLHSLSPTMNAEVSHLSYLMVGTAQIRAVSSIPQAEFLKHVYNTFILVMRRSLRWEFPYGRSSLLRDTIPVYYTATRCGIKYIDRPRDTVPRFDGINNREPAKSPTCIILTIFLSSQCH